jgi:hypothetical protein
VADLVPLGFLTFLDANGDPLAGGSVGYYDPSSPGTLTPVWADSAQATQLQNPVPLDAAGRPFSGGSEVGIWGVGTYRMIVRDVNGALQWSALTTVVSSTDISGLQAQITAETNARIAADDAEATARANADNTLTSNLNNEISRAEAAEAHLQSEIDAINAGMPSMTGLQHGINNVSASGTARVVFPTPYTNVPSVVCQCIANNFDVNIASILVDVNGFNIWIAFPNPATTPVTIPVQFHWVAVGT